MRVRVRVRAWGSGCCGRAPSTCATDAHTHPTRAEMRAAAHAHARAQAKRLGAHFRDPWVEDSCMIIIEHKERQKYQAKQQAAQQAHLHAQMARAAAEVTAAALGGVRQ